MTVIPLDLIFSIFLKYERMKCPHRFLNCILSKHFFFRLMFFSYFVAVLADSIFIGYHMRTLWCLLVFPLWKQTQKLCHNDGNGSTLLTFDLSFRWNSSDMKTNSSVCLYILEISPLLILEPEIHSFIFYQNNQGQTQQDDICYMGIKRLKCKCYTKYKNKLHSLNAL